MSRLSTIYSTLQIRPHQLQAEVDVVQPVSEVPCLHGDGVPRLEPQVEGAAPVHGDVAPRAARVQLGLHHLQTV